MAALLGAALFSNDAKSALILLGFLFHSSSISPLMSRGERCRGN